MPYRLTVRQFEQMIDAGIFRDKDNVELLGGILVDKMTKNDPHDFGVDFLGRTLGKIVEPDWIVRQEKSIVLGRFSRPQPDLAIVKGPDGRYRLRAPRPADIAFLIEVADSSYLKDRGVNSGRYAAARIPVYWIVNIPQFQIEIYSRPTGKGVSAAYRHVTVHGRDDQVPVVLDGKELGRIPVHDVVS
ncbi:MAG: Uma2 family endonuclease [Isosphaeraceae bacterium]